MKSEKKKVNGEVQIDNLDYLMGFGLWFGPQIQELPCFNPSHSIRRIKKQFYPYFWSFTRDIMDRDYNKKKNGIVFEPLGMQSLL